MSTARQLAVANENRQIDESVVRATSAAKSRTALESLASRLSVSASVLQDTLKNTAFKGCSNAEFVALVIVSNEYNLNPLLREIYAMPKKGGGIQAIVGYDGWIKIANSHPQFDGIEFDHVEDGNGNLKAVEGILYRKDRGHPTKKMVYLKEFKRNTDPWNNSPNHMLDVRCFCQTVRLGLGVALGVEGDENLSIDGGDIRSEPVSLPARQTTAEALNDEIPAFDRETGEIIEQDASGMTVVSEDEARELDAREGRDDSQMGEAHNGTEEAEQDEAPLWQGKFDELMAGLRAAKNASYIKAVETEYLKHAVTFSPEAAEQFEALLRERRTALAKTAEAAQ